MQHPKYMLTKLGASVSPSGASGSPLTIVKIFLNSHLLINEKLNLIPPGFPCYNDKTSSNRILGKEVYW